ncbi:hypothetical protein TPE_2700 [Treponema pedis str. T A4]|uniref:Uncharacterized protein n=1 Tax=Treponema pedis str. T A4 TaxID=1291379 RepID=S5ZR71_9SPIR|nr:hypothetical protein TPE_2700 [Treponema pedis str. T A4]
MRLLKTDVFKQPIFYPFNLCAKSAHTIERVCFTNSGSVFR